MQTETNQFSLLNHKPALFVLFFTEMWERFSYYGMRALLVLFLTSALFDDGWGWERSDALTLYGIYTGLVYLTPIIGGFLADKIFGYRNAVVLGALIMTLGHAFMAIETVVFFYLGLTCLILGNGLFKPNISSIVGQLYKSQGKEKDAGYTIFYMGINAGAFLGILLCGYIGEKVGWSYGFGLAGIFMLFGMLQFQYAQKIFGKIGLSPKRKDDFDDVVEDGLEDTKEAIEDVIDEAKQSKVARDRIIVISIFAFFTIFFWMAFEQAGGSMTIFAKDYTNRVLTGAASSTFKIVNTILVVAPLLIVTYVLYLLFRQTFKKYALSNIFLGTSFVVIWGIAIWLIQNDFNTKSYSVDYTDANGVEQVEKLRTTSDLNISSEVEVDISRSLEFYFSGDENNKENSIGANMIKDGDGEDVAMHRSGTVREFTSRAAKGLFWKEVTYAVVDYTDPNGTAQSVEIYMEDKFKNPEEFAELSEEEKAEHKEIAVGSTYDLKLSESIALDPKGDRRATVSKLNDDEVEIAASWFGILNSFFIIAFAPLFSRVWESKFNPSGPIKFAIGLTLLGIGFAALAYGAMGIPDGAKTASVSIVWLILAYLFHTLGELCVSPVGLAYVSKLAPVKLVGLMFGIWFVANFIANTLAGVTGSFIDSISDKYGLSTFFLIFTLIPIAAALIMVIISPMMLRKMHGIR